LPSPSILQHKHSPFSMSIELGFPLSVSRAGNAGTEREPLLQSLGSACGRGPDSRCHPASEAMDRGTRTKPLHRCDRNAWSYGGAEQSRFRTILLQAGLVVADGMPLVWLGRWHGHPMQRRCMVLSSRKLSAAPRAASTATSFMGDAGVADELARTMHRAMASRSPVRIVRHSGR